MPPLTLVFDLDGTLVDTAPDLVAATNHVLNTSGLAPVTTDSIRSFVGHGALAMIDGAAKARGRTFSQAELHELFDVFIAHYTAHIADASRPYPGVIAALDRAASRGAILAVCTNKLEAHAKQVLAALDLDTRFAEIIGRDSLAAHKPDPRHLTETITLSGGSVEHAVMVGDSETDIKTAKAAGVPVVAVSFGYSVQPVADFAPDAIIDHFDDLDDAVSQLQA